MKKIEKVSQDGRLNSLWKKEDVFSGESSWELLALSQLKVTSARNLLQEEKRKLSKRKRYLKPSLQENYWLNNSCTLLNAKL